jgi:hypothetical protein
MRRTIVALVPIVGSLLFAACSDSRDATSPRSISASRNASPNSPPTGCSFSTITGDANLYFPSRDAVFTMISDMKSLYQTRNGGAVAATPKGFDILARTADVRRQGLEIGDATAGGKFVSDLALCMDLGSIPSKFNPSAALLNGVFEVRGGSTDLTGPALAYNASPNTAATQASPLWGAEPKTGSWVRTAATYGRYLVYGYPLGTDVTTSGFELGTLPASLSSFLASTDDAFRVGLCIRPANSSLTAANRLVHLGAIVTDPNSVLQQGTHFCSGNVTSTGSTTWFASIMHRAASLFAPKPALAQFDFAGIGGLPDGWSPFNPNSIAGSNVVLTFGALPKNVRDSTQFTLVVHASSPGIANVPGVSISLAVANNSGTPAQAVLIPSDASAITQTNGDATFHIAIGKPGGYTLTATGNISGVLTAGFTSAVFNIKN